jgi:mRNA interferase RelE/StbE
VKYAVLLERAAERELADLPRDIREEIIERLEALGDDPVAPGAQALAGNLRGLFKLRAGRRYRVAYQVDATTKTVTVRGVGHRDHFYDRIARRYQA